MAPRRRRSLSGRRRFSPAKLAIVVAVIAALGAVAAAATSALFGGGAGDTADRCDITVPGSGNVVNCASPGASGDAGEGTDRHEPPPPKVEGEKIPLSCLPPGERPVALEALEVTVRRWCSQSLRARLAKRQLAQTKVQLTVVNRTERRVDIRATRWFLLVPGTSPAKRWSGKPGAQWPRPKVIEFQDRAVTAIPANPPRDAEVQEIFSNNFADLTFATCWKTDSLAPGRTFRPKTRPGAPCRDRDGVLVFYVPLVKKRDPSPRVLGLALMQGDEVLAFCPRGRCPDDEASTQTF